MSSKACSADNVIGQVLGLREYDGKAVGMDVVEGLDSGGKATYVNARNAIGAVIEDESAPTNQAQQVKVDSDRKALGIAQAWLGDAPAIAPSIITDVRNPSGVLGEEFIKPVVDFITEHHTDHFDDLKAGRNEYFGGIDDIFDELDIQSDGLDSAQQAFYKKYKSFYKDGGELYNLNQRSGIEKALSNLGGNVIKSSPNVILGNVLEATIKLPTLYPTTMVQGFAEAAKQGLFKKIPELEKQGVYGIHYAGEKLGIWEGLIGLTDAPLKNVAYYAGQAADGNGLKAVQKIAFTPRFGDLPSIYYGTGGRATVQFLSYTINTYKMYGSLLMEAKKGNFQPLLTSHLMSGLVGGGAAAGVPLVAEKIITTVAPDSQEWFDENKGMFADLVQPSNINRLGVGYDIANRQFKSIGKNWENGIGRIQDGDLTGGALDLADAALNAFAFTSSPAGDLNVQKALRIGKEVAQGELELEDVPDEAIEKFLPYLKQDE